MNPFTNTTFMVSSSEPHPPKPSANPRCMPGGYADCMSGVTAEGRWERSCIHGPGPGGIHSTVNSLICPPVTRVHVPDGTGRPRLRGADVRRSVPTAHRPRVTQVNRLAWRSSAVHAEIGRTRKGQFDVLT